MIQSHWSDAVQISTLLLPRLPGALVHAGKSSISFPARLRSGSHLLAFLRVDPEISWSTNPSVCLLIVFLFHLTTSCFFYECVICVCVCVCVKCVSSAGIWACTSTQNPLLPLLVLMRSFLFSSPSSTSYITSNNEDLDLSHDALHCKVVKYFILFLFVTFHTL